MPNPAINARPHTPKHSEITKFVKKQNRTFSRRNVPRNEEPANIEPRAKQFETNSRNSVRIDPSRSAKSFQKQARQPFTQNIASPKFADTPSN